MFSQMEENMFRILTVNPGSTSTKIGVYENETQIIEETLRHSAEEIGSYDTILDQLDFRKNVIVKVLEEKDFDLSSLSCVVGRGGLLKPIPSGTYLVNDRVIEDLKIGYQGQHASNLGGIIASEIAKQFDIPAYIVDPVVVDELQDVARVSGMPEVERKSIFHALNQKAVAKRWATEMNKRYEESNLIVVHMGGGVSVGAHKNGKVIDVNNVLDGEGPFSPERSGGIPAKSIAELCFSDDYSLEDIKKKINGNGGIVAYCNTIDFRDLESDVNKGDEKAKLIYDAFIYQIGKEIGTAAAVLFGKVDSIILTGGIAYSKTVVEKITEMVSFVGPIKVYPGEDELLALAQGGLRVLKGEEEYKEYN